MSLARAIGVALFRGLSGRGMSTFDLISIARQAGGTYRRQDMLADIRASEGRFIHQAQIERLPFSSVIPRNWMVQEELGINAKYRVFGNLTVYDDETDTYLTQRASFYTDDLSTSGDYAESFFSHYSSRYQDQDLEITEFKVTGLFHNIGYDY